MTGAYLRVQRNGVWENIQIEHLTDTEREIIFLTKAPEETMRWLNLLCGKLVDAEKFLDGLVEDGIIGRRV